MPFSNIGDSSTVYQRLLKWVFSGNVTPGAKLVERSLASELGVSRIPVRESVREMVAQGLLVGGEKWEGVRTRHYDPEEIRQLTEFREIFEGGAAGAAARHATDVDLARMEMICREADAEVGNYGSQRWAQLDHHFHAAMADASHNQRVIHCLRHLLAECHYVFYIHPGRVRRRQPSAEEAAAHMARVVEDHRAMIEAIGARDPQRASRLARAHMRVCGRQAAEEIIASDLDM